MRRVIRSVVVAVAFFAPAAASAQSADDTTGTGGRCALLGQIAVSEWLELLTVLGSNDRDTIDGAMTRTERASTLYTGVGCDGAALASAMDCVLLSDAGNSPRDRARGCLVTAGLAQ